MLIHEEIKRFLKKRYEGTNSQCQKCNSNCCNGPGFAILENVIEIYNLYSQNKLHRSDFQFKSGLSLVDFIFEYFDIALMNSKLLMFFPKMLTDDDKLISVPPYDFWNARDYLMKRYKSYGCIFLDKKQTSKAVNNSCILHNDDYLKRITEKPVDCLFLCCYGLKDIKKATEEESSTWFEILDKHYPNSNERFTEICPERSKFNF